MSTSKMRPIDLLRSANRYKKRREEIDIPLDDGVLTVMLEAPDILDLMEKQEIIYQGKLAECEALGLANLPVSETEWRKDLSTYSDATVRRNMEKKKPANAAEFVATRITRFATVKVLLPKYLRDKETGEKICQTQDDVEFFTQIFSSDLALFKEAMNKYTKLVVAANETRDAAKNSLTPPPPQE